MTSTSCWGGVDAAAAVVADAAVCGGRGAALVAGAVRLGYAGACVGADAAVVGVELGGR